ncbi:MAG: pantetheine-phosphate adenylyltransferase [Syntrophomonadaceae bacterium]|nr:pantetheine-phosphate adenylyltransferase [Syntrophomonadaceae bacterium]
MKIAVYPGSFDPVTNGHVDILERTSRAFDKIIVAVVQNVSKQPLFTLEERVNLIKETTKHLDNIEVESFCGLLVDYLKVKNVNIIIRGLRSATDFEYESNMSMINKKLMPAANTMFIMADSNYICISSSGVKEAALLGGDVSSMVPPAVAAGLKEKLRQMKALK